jgi:4-hydroxy-2-oxoglutarate aldolase
MFNSSIRSVRIVCSTSAKKSFNKRWISYDRDNLSGIIPSLITPFKRSQSEMISWKDFEHNLNHWSKIPFPSYLVHGFYSEYPYLSNEERIEVVKFVKSFTSPQRTIVVGSSSESIKDTLHHSESMKRHGANYTLLYSPSYYKRQMNYFALLQYYIKVADQSPLPIILHSMPLHLELSSDLIVDLADHPNIVGIVENSIDIAKIADVCERIQQKSSICDFSVLGPASVLLETLTVGGHGSMTPLATVFGPELVKIYNLFNSNQESQLDKAKLMQNRLVPIDYAIKEKYGVPGLKALMDSINGYFGSSCRLPLIDISEDDLNSLRILLEQNGFQWNSNKFRYSVN